MKCFKTGKRPEPKETWGTELAFVLTGAKMLGFQGFGDETSSFPTPLLHLADRTGVCRPLDRH